MPLGLSVRLLLVACVAVILSGVLLIESPLYAQDADAPAADQSSREAAPPAGSPTEPKLMNNRRLGRLLKKHFPEREIAGQPGFWRVEASPAGEPEQQPDEEKAEANGRPQELGPGAGGRMPGVVLVLTDERADRMRIMSPIRGFNPDEPEDLRLALIALHANYDRALDARYAIQDDVLWSVFIHPLSSLTARDLASALRQVQTLRDNTGTTYNSGELFFQPGPDPREEPPEPPDEEERDDII